MESKRRVISLLVDNQSEMCIRDSPSKRNVEIRSFDKILLLIYTGMHIHMQKSRIEDRKLSLIHISPFPPKPTTARISSR